jgi:NAD(P)-dependent dehydrogenase (short-subunit alcohol dehydrogenase family)
MMQASQSRFDLTGRAAFVTGASGGLGLHFARTLARAGARVAIAARRADKLAEAVAAIETEGGCAIAIPMDVGSRASVCAGLDLLERSVGTPDIIVNNAGVGTAKRALECNDADWASVVGTNLTGAWIVAQESARRMVAANKAGSIINITSILANRVANSTSLYCASKSGLKHLTQALAVDLARHGIRVNSVAPGYTVTDLNREYLRSEPGERLRSRIPARRFCEYHELDGALLLLASDAGTYMTGAEIVVDGGHSCNAL